MKITNYFVDYMVYVSLLGKSLFLAFGKGFLGLRKIFTPGHTSAGPTEAAASGRGSVTCYNSKSNGGSERAIRSLKDCLKRDGVKKLTQEILDRLTFNINGHPQD